MIKIGDYIRIKESQKGIKYWYTSDSLQVVGIEFTRKGEISLELDKDIHGLRFIWEGHAELDVKKNREEKIKSIFND